jgi:hypothetical protein
VTQAAKAPGAGKDGTLTAEEVGTFCKNTLNALCIKVGVTQF